MTYPQNAVAGSRALSLSVSPSIAGSLFSALEYLTSFPYGCVEQTMSSFLPDIVVKDAVQSLALKTDLNAERSPSPKKIQGRSRAPLRLSARRRRMGLVGNRCQPSVCPVTAYVKCSGLVQAKAAGTHRT